MNPVKQLVVVVLHHDSHISQKVSISGMPGIGDYYALEGSLESLHNNKSTPINT